MHLKLDEFLDWIQIDCILRKEEKGERPESTFSSNQDK